MWPFRRKKTPASPDPVYTTEAPHVQMRIIRTHIAAQAGELGNLNIAVGQLCAKLDQLLHAVAEIHVSQYRRPAPYVPVVGPEASTSGLGADR